MYLSPHGHSEVFTIGTYGCGVGRAVVEFEALDLVAPGLFPRGGGVGERVAGRGDEGFGDGVPPVVEELGGGVGEGHVWVGVWHWNRRGGLVDDGRNEREGKEKGG